MSTLYVLQYSLDPFHIYTSYQASSQGVSCVNFFFQNLKIWSFGKFLKFVTLTLSCFDLGFNMNWSIVWVIMGQQVVSSERKRSSCSSYIPRFNEIERGYTGFTLSVCPSVHPSVDRIVSALYLQQYSWVPFHICTSYWAASEGVWRVKFLSKFEILANS